MKKRFIITGSILTACHLVALWVVFFITFAAGMEQFDNPERMLTTVEKVAHAVLMVLWQPAYSLWTPWMSKHMPDILEWMLLFANSMLWGFVLALLICLVFRVKHKGLSDNNSLEDTVDRRARASS